MLIIVKALLGTLICIIYVKYPPKMNSITLKLFVLERLIIPLLHTI